MIILADTRQQDKKHLQKERWFRDHGIEVRRTKLYVGDYTLPTDQSICIDTKRDFQEICGNLANKSEHERLAREADRAKEAGIRLIYLVENDGGEIGHTGIYNKTITSLFDVHSWKNPRLFIMDHGKQKYPRATKGITLQKMMYSFQQHHGCEFMFCASRDSAKKIVELLGGEEK